ncbi:MAG: hypothetical protein AAF902_18160 [Chloroflexota bacterium]
MTPYIRTQLRTAARVAGDGKIPAAIELYRELIEKEPDVAEAYIGLGNVLPDESDRRDAYNKALEIDPKNIEAINSLAVLDGKEPPEINLLKQEEKVKIQAKPEPKIDGPETATVENGAIVQNTISKVEPIVGGTFSHPVDISEFVMPDGTMVDYKTGEPTNLRCNRCGRPITLKSSKSTSVGYRCEICIRELEDGYYEATTSDYVISSLITVGLSILVGVIAGLIGGGGFFFLFIAFAVGGAIGAGIARLAQQSIGRRRGRGLANLLSTLMGITIFLSAFLFGGALLMGGILAFAAASGARVQLR